jgi:hypothetical protein
MYQKEQGVRVKIIFLLENKFCFWSVVAYTFILTFVVPKHMYIHLAQLSHESLSDPLNNQSAFKNNQLAFIELAEENW